MFHHPRRLQCDAGTRNASGRIEFFCGTGFGNGGIEPGTPGAPLPADTTELLGLDVRDRAEQREASKQVIEGCRQQHELRGVETLINYSGVTRSDSTSVPYAQFVFVEATSNLPDVHPVTDTFSGWAESGAAFLYPHR
jgi:hypothetical protein